MLWLLIAFAGIGCAQLRRSGDGRETVARSTLRRDTLADHNAVRERVGVAALQWSDRLATRAQDWADTLLARKQFAHRPNSPYGENLFEIRGGGVTRASGSCLGRGIRELRPQVESMPRRVRALYANRLGRHQRSRLRGGARRRPRGVDLRIRSAGQLGRQGALLSHPDGAPSAMPFPNHFRRQERRIESGAAGLYD